ncbi:MAG: macro domain-containing protein [Anaerolineaceae bacterium]|nr:macro domain-containing protein [Anaerolineaceae bacterium]
MEESNLDQKRRTTFPSGITLEILLGDITRIDTDVIVNAANKHLSHGGGVAAAIVRRGGQIIQEESREWVKAHGPISTNHPAFTTAGNLNCKFIIHVVGPVWGEGNEDRKLAGAIHSSLLLANDLQAESISFPAISTGIFGFPADRAANIFMEEIFSFCKHKQTQSIKGIALVLFNTGILNTFIASFDAHFNQIRK